MKYCISKRNVLLNFLNNADRTHMPESAKLIMQSLKDGTYRRHRKFTKWEVSEIIDIRIVEEKAGTGVSFVCDNGMEYRFAVFDENHTDYYTPQKLMQAAIEYSKEHDAKTTLNFVRHEAAQYYESAVTGNIEK